MEDTELVEMRNRIEEQIGKQNEILADCINKYKQSNNNVSGIADQIAIITGQITKATNDLQTIAQHHETFKKKYKSETQRFKGEKAEMETQYLADKQKIIHDIEKRNMNKKQEEGTKRAEEEAKADEDRNKHAKELEDAHNTKIKENEDAMNKLKENLVSEKNTITANLNDYESKLKNEKFEQAKMKEAAEKQHDEDMEKLTSDSQKLVKAESRVEELGRKMEEMDQNHKNAMTELLNQTIKEVDELTAKNETKIENMIATSKQHEEGELAKAKELADARENEIRMEHEGITHAAKEKGGNELKDLQEKLDMCQEQKDAAARLLDENEEKVNKLRREFEQAAEIGQKKLEDNVNNLAKENVTLQKQIEKMKGSSPKSEHEEEPTEWTRSRGPPPPSSRRKPLAPFAKEASIAPPPPPRKGSPRLHKSNFYSLNDQKKIAVSEALEELKSAHETLKLNPSMDQSMDSHKALFDKYKEQDGLVDLNSDEISILEELWYDYLKDVLKGGYKHGKSSNKKNKRSLKSKLTAKKYSLKIKKKGKKGKTNKRRKSIKIRI